VLRWAGSGDTALAAGLGADVPFCVAGGRALVKGVGEVIEALPFEDRQFTLLLLPFGVDTAEVYRTYDRLQGKEALADAGAVTNDLAAAALVVEPRLDQWRKRFEELTGRRPHLAGSGSTWFIEGSPEALGLADARVLGLEKESAVVVSARTTPTMI
jgi:4-diphosphocytidyl-2-C-methyl-D-erythritol kinase